jgi:two-component system sensor histidine kinase CiaH
MKNDKKKVRHQEKRIILTHFLTFVLLFMILGIFIIGLINMFFFRGVNRELREFKNAVIENIEEYEIEGRNFVSISPRINARVFVILYQEDGKVYAFDRNILNFVISDLKEEYSGGFHNNPNIEEEEILAALNHEIFKYRSHFEVNHERINDKEVYHFQTLSFPLTNNDAPNVKSCKLILMINGEIESRNLVLKVYILSSLLMFIFAFIASLYLSRMALKPVRSALDKQLVFVSDASHELRTPLAIVRNRLENILAKSNRTVYEVSDDIAISLKEITRLSKLTNDLLTLAHSDNEALKLKTEEFDLMELAKDVVIPFSEMAEIQNKNFVITGEKAIMTADKEKISQLLIILLDNALKYTVEKEEVRILIKQTGNDIYLSVTDTGVGIDDEMKPYVFERFYRADKARSRETGGNGLGLSIAKTIVKLHRGQISLNDNTPKGTKITIVFPKSRNLKKNKLPLQG